MAYIPDTLEQTMWYHGGIIRNQNSLKDALAKIHSVTQILPEVMVSESEDLLDVVEFNHMLTASEIVCRAAMETLTTHCAGTPPLC